MSEPPPELVALVVRDAPAGEPRTFYVERAALARLIVEAVSAGLARPIEVQLDGAPIGTIRREGTNPAPNP